VALIEVAGGGISEVQHAAVDGGRSRSEHPAVGLGEQDRRGDLVDRHHVEAGDGLTVELRDATGAQGPHERIGRRRHGQGLRSARRPEPWRTPAR
jgi:hypothetical protein